MPKVRWVMSYGFVANFMRFPTVQNCWKSTNIWQSYRECKGGNFFETRCRKEDYIGTFACEVPQWIADERKNPACIPEDAVSAEISNIWKDARFRVFHLFPCAYCMLLNNIIIAIMIGVGFKVFIFSVQSLRAHFYIWTVFSEYFYWTDSSHFQYECFTRIVIMPLI